MTGTWVIKQVASAADLSDFVLTNALATPNVRGFSMRVPWSSIPDMTSMNALLGLGLTLANNAGVAFSVRFIAGSLTPSTLLLAGTHYLATPVGGGAQVVVPAPFNSNGTPNTIFETAYDTEVATLATWCHANGVHLLHLPWYGVNYAELNMGNEVRSLTGFTYSNWLTAHERLVDIAFKYRASDLAIEYPMSGYGPLTGSGSLTLGNAVDDLSNYIVSKSGGNKSNVFIQANGLGQETWGTGDWGTTDQSVESAMDTSVWPKSIGHGEQMIDAFDYDWVSVFSDLQANGAVYVEIYAFSFTGDKPHHAELLNEITKFAGVRTVVASTPASPQSRAPGVSQSTPGATPSPRIALSPRLQPSRLIGVKASEGRASSIDTALLAIKKMIGVGLRLRI